MSNKPKIVFGLNFIFSIICGAQGPIVTEIIPSVVFPTQEITLKGSNLGSDPASIIVNIGGAHADVITATQATLTIKVPISSRSGTIEIINSEGLVGYSNIPLVYTHSGSDNFDVDKLIPIKFEGAEQTAEDLCACDIDNDGDTDIVGAGAYININLNEGTEGDYKQLKTSYIKTFIESPKRMACSDLNGDGYPDLAFTSRQEELRDKVLVVLNSQNNANPFKNSDVVMYETVSADLEGKPELIDIEIRDLDQDGKQDIVVASNTATSENDDQLSDIFIFKNNTSGIVPDFSKIFEVKLSNGFVGAYEVVLEDINFDNRMDILVAERGQRIVLLTNSGEFQFKEKQLVLFENKNKDISSIAVGDYNQDGLLDLVTVKGGRASKSSGDILMFKNTGSTQFVLDESYNSSMESKPNSIELQDINGDLNLDIIVSTRLGFEAFIRSSDNTSFIQVSYEGDSGTQENVVRCLDMNGDGMPEIILSKEKSAPEVLINENKFQARVYPKSPIKLCGEDQIILYGTKGVGLSYQWGGDLVDLNQIHQHQYHLTMNGGELNGLFGIKFDNEQQNYLNPQPAEVSITHYENPPPSIPFIDYLPTVCIGDSIVLNTTAEASDYLWTGPNGFTSNQKKVVIKDVELIHTGTYSLIISEPNSCMSEPAQIVVEVINLDVITIQSEPTDVNCVQEPVILSIKDDIAGATYQWFKNNEAIVGANMPNLVVNSSGEYYVQVNLNQCVKFCEVVKVTFGSEAELVNEYSVCLGDSILLSISEDVQDFSWNTGATTHSIWGIPGENYQATIKNQFGCEATQIFSIIALDTPQVSIEVAKTVLAPNETVDLFATPGYASYEWSPAEGLSDPTVSSPTAAPTQTRTTYTVTVATESGCSSSAEVTIDIGGKITVYPEKAFTPNFDNHNDQWHIANMEAYPDCNVTIFTRSGIKVYEGKNYDNNKWNGTFNGKQLTEGAYFYVIECQDTENIEGRVTGSVSLVR